MKTFFAAVSYSSEIKFFETIEDYRNFVSVAVVNNLDIVTFQSFRCHDLSDETLRVILGKIVACYNIPGQKVAEWFNHARHIMVNEEALYRFVTTQLQ
jgi:hypothetical protein